MTKKELRELLAPRPPDNPVVITTGRLVGLGDHAMMTTLPERFSKLGYDVYLDKDMMANNDGIRQLLWESNPYIKGLSDKKPNAGYGASGAIQGRFYTIANALPGCRSIEAIERANGLPPPYGMAPKIYYEPKPFFIDLSNKVLVDFTAVSSHIGLRGKQEAVNMMKARFDDPKGENLLQVIHKKHVALHPPQIAAQGYEIRDIFEYMDMLHACRAWIGSEAGGQSLASAVRGEHDVYDMDARPEIVCTIVPRTFNSRGYTYRNVDYRVTSDTEAVADYWQPHEVSVFNYEQQCLTRQIMMLNRAG